MSIELILGGTGTALGIANFIYWTWWARRERVLIVNHEVSAEFLKKGTVQRTYRSGAFTSINHAVSIEAICELSLTRTETPLEVKEVEVTLNEGAAKNLRQYFQTPLRNRFQLYYMNNYEEGSIFPKATLEPKKTVQFKGEIDLNCTDKFESEYEKIGSVAHPEFIQPFLDGLEAKYQICWTSYKGKKICWSFPDKWWRNLGKKIWG